MDVLAPVRAFDRFQQRHRPLALPVAVLKKYADDGAGNLAALMAFRGFFAVFPLLLILTTVLGFVLQGNAKLQEDILNSVLADLPVIGDQLRVESLGGSTSALVIGLVLSLWAGLGITVAARMAMDQIWAVPHKNRPDFLGSRLRGLAFLAIAGVLNIGATITSGLVSAGLGDQGTFVQGIVASFALNLALFFASFRILTSRTITTRALLPGIVMAAIGWEILQALGGVYVQHVVRRAGPTYGTFALVIGLMAWLHLGAVNMMYAAEVNVVRRRHLWPRSLFGVERAEDEKTLAALAKVEERDPRERVEVHFEPPSRADDEG